MALPQPSSASCPLSASLASNCRFSKMVHATFLTTSESSMTRQVFMLTSNISQPTMAMAQWHRNSPPGKLNAKR